MRWIEEGEIMKTSIALIAVAVLVGGCDKVDNLTTVNSGNV